jgi:AAA15 family ATPase/GTPase
MVKDLKKTIRLMSREEFAHKRALILTLKSLADKFNYEENIKILKLLHEKKIDAIEEELKKIKKGINLYKERTEEKRKEG